MKSLILSAAALIALGSAFVLAGEEKCTSCGKGESMVSAPATKPATNPATKPVNTMCPIMADHPINAKVTTVYKGKTIAFCCRECIDTFNENPEKFIADMK